MSEKINIEITPDELRKMIIQGVKDHLKQCSRSLYSKNEEFLTRAEVAKMLKVDLSTVDSWSKSGHLKKKRIGGKSYFLRSQIEDSLTEAK